jgi:hypothetical protein
MAYVFIVSIVVMPFVNLSNLISLDIFQSTKLVNTWVESNIALEVHNMDLLIKFEIS